MGKKPTVLLILDGYGIARKKEISAIEGHAPNIDEIIKNYPTSKGEASGFAVGLPEGQMGNSEVGHLNLGAGRIVDQPFVKITKQILNGEFFDNKVLKEAVSACKEKGTKLHILGLLSDGGVHSHNTHLYALLELMKKEEFTDVFVHAFMDGRDTDPTAGRNYLKELNSKMDELGTGKIATVMGRYYAMDRDNRWDRVEKAYDAMTLGEGEEAPSYLEAIDNSYSNKATDEFVLPTVVKENGLPVAKIEDGDSVIFFNFRTDRAREITKAFCEENFNEFTRKKVLTGLNYVCFTECDPKILNKKVAFVSEEIIKNTIAEYLSNLGLKQLHVAETEKYAHVTFFFNGGIEKEYDGEDRLLINSPKVATYDLKPEMSVYEITENLLDRIDKNIYDFIVVNFANGDMVGHTGIFDAASRAVSAVDECTKKLVDKIIEVDGQMFICADHGNVEEMYTDSGDPHTAHTTNLVPFILVNYKEGARLRDGRLGDVAPTILEMMGLEKPDEMTGNSLIEKL